MGESNDYVSRLVNEQSLKSFLQTEFGSENVIDINRHQGGHSNETLFITWGPQDLVLRRPPPGETAQGAHDVLREYQVLSSLQKTSVPTPHVYTACEDTSVIGSEFYIMEQIHGSVFRESEPDFISQPEHRQRIGQELIDTLAKIHTVDYEAVGLADLGRPEGYLERQVDRWRKQYEWARERTEAVRALPGVEGIGQWLETNIPEPPAHTLVHGDYKLDNVMVSTDTPPVIKSVFDWEMSTLGDPLSDLGWLLHYWRDPDDPAPQEGEFAPEFTAKAGYPTRQELIDRYERKTGIEFKNPRFYRTLTAFKLGAVGEMFFRRHLEGNSEDEKYPQMKTYVPALIQRAETYMNATDANLI